MPGYASLIPNVVLIGATFALVLFVVQLTMFGSTTLSALLAMGISNAVSTAAQTQNIVDVTWHAPNKSWINDLVRVLNASGTYGFVFSGSDLPEGVPYGTYNWCNMPHVRAQEYPRPSDEFELSYVEVIHRHHKRIPYADNTFPIEPTTWSCSDSALFYSASPLDPSDPSAASTYWNISKSSINPFRQRGFNGSCAFPQITSGGLVDSFQHGLDLRSVYLDLLAFLPRTEYGDDVDHARVEVHVTGNTITSQVASMLVAGLFALPPGSPYPLVKAPDATDPLEPAYPCPASSVLFASYGVGSSSPAWTAHLTASAALFADLDAISGVPTGDSGWHRSWDHYFDNLSARQCHARALPCAAADPENCVEQQQADAVYRLGQYEYSYIYRDAAQSLAASTPAFGLWLGELAENIRAGVEGRSKVVYRHNVAHDGSLSRLLGVLQVEEMVWPGMGAEVVFEVWRKKGEDEAYLRILFSGQVLRSSSPELGRVDMIPVERFLGYVDGLVGAQASRIVELCRG